MKVTDKDFRALLNKTFSSHESIIFGEKHQDGNAIRQLLIECSEDVKKHKVHWIGLEGPWGPMLNIQSALDSTDTKDLGVGMLNYLRGSEPGLGDVADFMMEEKIKPVCYDYTLELKLGVVNKSDAKIIHHSAGSHLREPEKIENWAKTGKTASKGGKIKSWENGSNFYNRCVAMNHYAVHRFGKLALPKTGFIIIVGSMHLDKRFKHNSLQSLVHHWSGHAPAVIDTTEWERPWPE